MSRLLAYGFGLGMVALTASAGLRAPRDDSYPLSTYPMFARPRGKPLLRYVEALDADGRATRIPPELVAHDEVMQAVVTVRRAVEGGPEAMSALCARIAHAVRADPAYAQAQTLRLVGARFDPLRYFSEGPVPEEQIEHFRCSVPRPP